METQNKNKFTLKNALPGLSPKTLFIVFGCLGFALLLLRIAQTQLWMDPETGFFTDSSHFSVLPFYILSIGFALGALVLFYLGRQLPVAGLGVRRSVPHAFTLLLTAAAVAYDGMMQLAVYNAGEEPVYTNGNLINATRRVLFIYVVFALLSALVFLLDSVAFFSGASFGAKLRILRLVPVFWAFFRTVRFFAITASYIHSTQLFLTIFASAFLMLFLFEYARKIAGMAAEENTAVFCASGLIAGVLLITVGVTDLLLKLTGKGAMPHCEFAPYTLAAGLFCFTALGLLKTAAPAGEEEIPTAPLPET